MARLGEMHIEGPPVPKGRPQFKVNKQTGAVITYTPPKTVAYEHLIGLSWRGRRRFEGAVKVTVKVIEGAKGHPGDLDNYVKCLLDGLNGIAWVDDKQVVGIDAAIIRDDPKPRLDVIVDGWPVSEAVV